MEDDRRWVRSVCGIRVDDAWNLVEMNCRGSRCAWWTQSLNHGNGSNNLVSWSRCGWSCAVDEGPVDCMCAGEMV